jgi:hypothetical protein
MNFEHIHEWEIWIQIGKTCTYTQIGKLVTWIGSVDLEHKLKLKAKDVNTMHIWTPC